MARKRNALIDPIKHSAPKQSLEKIGGELVLILAKQAEARRQMDHLWQLYLQDCHRHGILPPVEAVYLPKLLPFPCPICSQRSLSPLQIKNLGGFTCKECGRLVCNHTGKERPLCYDCAAPPVESKEEMAEGQPD